MAQLRAKARAKLPASAFAYPKSRRYPIDTPARARNALARAAQPKTRGSYSTVARAVRRRYGNTVASVGTKRGTVSAPGYRRAKGGSGSSTATRRASSAARGQRSMTSGSSARRRR